MYPRWGSEVEHRGLTRKAVRLEVGSECVVRHSPGSTAGQGAWEKASHPRTGPCCPLAKGKGDGSVETGSCALPSSPSWDPEKKETALFLKFWIPPARGLVAEQNKKETKDSPPGPPPGEGVVRSPSPDEQDPEAPGRPSQGRRLPWRFTGLAGAEAGCAAVLRPAPRCGCREGCCHGRAGAEVEAAGGRPRRRADGGAAAGGNVLETAADHRGRMWQNASVCFCAAENCWAKSSTASPNRPAWEIGESRKRCLSDSLISAKVSHRWRSWTTNVDIFWPRARAVTFVALRARSVAVRSSCNTPGSAPPSCNCFNALAWWTCRRAMACRAEASCTSGKKGTGGGCRRSACAPRNQSSSLERSGEGGGLQCSPTLSAARESIAVSSGSDSGNATLPDGGCSAEPSSPEPSSSPDASACWKPKHEGQRSWPSDEARKRPHPETHEREAISKKAPVARGALLDLLFSKRSFKSAEAPRGGCSVTAEESCSTPSGNAALDSNLRWTPTPVVL